MKIGLNIFCSERLPPTSLTTTTSTIPQSAALLECIPEIGIRYTGISPFLGHFLRFFEDCSAMDLDIQMKFSHNQARFRTQLFAKIWISKLFSSYLILILKMGIKHSSQAELELAQLMFCQYQHWYFKSQHIPFMRSHL